MTENVKKFGLVGAAIMFSLNFIVYYLNPELFVSFTLLGISLLILIVCLVLAGIGDRKANGGFISFGAALKSTFFTSVLIALGGLIGGVILFNLVDTDLAMQIENMTMQMTNDIMERFNAPSSAIDEALDEIEGMHEDYSIFGQVVKTAQGLILYLIISLIIAAIIKKSEPV
jgi:hypothetical protein